MNENAGFCAHYQICGKSDSGRVLAMEAHNRQTHPERSGTARERVCEPYKTATAAQDTFSATCHFLPEMGNKFIFLMCSTESSSANGI